MSSITKKQALRAAYEFIEKKLEEESQPQSSMYYEVCEILRDMRECI